MASETPVADQAKTTSVTMPYWIMWVILSYWLVSAPLQVWWWKRGYDHFWRPMTSWGLSLVVVTIFLGLPVLLLLWPRFRRWLFQQWKPFDPPLAEVRGT